VCSASGRSNLSWEELSSGAWSWAVLFASALAIVGLIAGAGGKRSVDSSLTGVQRFPRPKDDGSLERRAEGIVLIERDDSDAARAIEVEVVDVRRRIAGKVSPVRARGLELTCERWLQLFNAGRSRAMGLVKARQDTVTEASASREQATVAEASMEGTALG